MRKPFDGNFVVTQGFGNKLYLNGVDVYAQWGYKGHNGIDYGTPTGTPILAPHSGKIIEAAFDQYGYGNYVKIENSVEGSVLAHFSKTLVSVGQEVNQGQQIALSGNTGNSTGPHLHWGYYRHPRNRKDGYGGFIDQTPYIGVTSSDNNMDIKKATQLDRVLNYLKDRGYITDNDSRHYLNGEFVDLIKKLYDDYRSQRTRAGWYDKAVNLVFGKPTDSTKTTFELFEAEFNKAVAGKDVKIAQDLANCQANLKLKTDKYYNLLEAVKNLAEKFKNEA